MVLGGQEGQGFKQFMAALELGRVNVAARGLGLARSAFDHAIAYADERETFGKPIADHQSIQIKLAQMATKIRAAELLVLDAAERKQAGERADLQAGMAKLFATETAEECALDALRIYGGAGYSQDNPVERLTATRRCSSSARAPTRSSTSSSPGGSWRRGGTPR